jgi:uncharacterized protein (TIGR02118 family)
MFVNIVTTQCQPEDDRKFNEWYNNVHIPMLMKFKGLEGATRYKVLVGPGEPIQYSAVYYFTNKDAFEAFVPSQERAAAVKDMEITWGDKIKIVGRQQLEHLKDWKNI